MSDASVTVTGYVGTTPELHLSANQVPWTSFRVASTRRVRDPRTGEWRDGTTTWFTVKAFRAAARTLSESLVQGQPVVVAGRLSAESWTDRDGHERSNLVVEADAVGPDATRGVTRFARARLDTPPTGSTTSGDGPDGRRGDGDDPWARQGPDGDPWAEADAGPPTPDAPPADGDVDGEPATEPAPGAADEARPREPVGA